MGRANYKSKKEMVANMEKGVRGFMIYLMLIFSWSTTNF
jgi:hypothetical protein